jgi:hypothetical protein
MTGYSVTILKCIMRWFLHDDVSCIANVAADVSNKSKESVMTKKQGYLWPNQLVTEPETQLMAPSRCSADGRLWRKWCFIHDQNRSSQIETTSMTTHQSSQNGDTSVTKITISSPMTKCDATIVTKFKSSQTRHKWTLVTIMASSVTLGERHRWQHPY